MLSQTNRIDFVAQSPDGEIAVVMTAAENWSTDARALEMLSDKIETYVSFIKGTQFRQQYGDTTAYIELVAIHEPTSQVKKLLDAASAATGIRIRTRRMEPGVGGFLGGGLSGPMPDRASSRRVAQRKKPQRGEARAKDAERRRRRSKASRPPALPSSLEELIAETDLDCIEIDRRTLAVPLEGDRVEQIVIQARQLDEELVTFAVPLPEPQACDREAALEGLLRTSFTANYAKPLSTESGRLLWTVQLPTSLLTPDVAEGLVRGLGQLADVTEKDLADDEDRRGRLVECRMAQAAHISVDAASAERQVRAELESAGLTTKREFEDAVLTNFAKVGEAEIDLLARYHERVISFIIYLPGLQPRGDRETYLERLLQLNANAIVGRTGIDNDGDLAILYEIPGFQPGMFREVVPQLKSLFQGVLRIHANA